MKTYGYQIFRKSDCTGNPFGFVVKQDNMLLEVCTPLELPFVDNQVDFAFYTDCEACDPSATLVAGDTTASTRPSNVESTTTPIPTTTTLPEDLGWHTPSARHLSAHLSILPPWVFTSFHHFLLAGPLLRPPMLSGFLFSSMNLLFANIESEVSLNPDSGAAVTTCRTLGYSYRTENDFLSQASLQQCVLLDGSGFALPPPSCIPSYLSLSLEITDISGSAKHYCDAHSTPPTSRSSSVQVLH